MARLVVTFTTAYPSPTRAGGPLPLTVGARCRTVVLDTGDTDGGGSAEAALAGEHVMALHAMEDTWYAIGQAEDLAATEGGANSRFLPAGGDREHWVEPGDRVAIADAGTA